MEIASNNAQSPEKVSNYLDGSITLIEGNSVANSGNIMSLSPLELSLWNEAEKNKQDYQKLWQLVYCESKWKTDAVGDRGLAYGILQFHKNTFQSFKKIYGWEELDYNDAEDQIKLGVRMIADGYYNHWTCWRKLRTYAIK